MCRQYKRQKLNVEHILDSHKLQQQGKKRLHKLLPAEAIIPRTGFVPKDKKVVISYGGDNHFQYVARYLDNQILIGLNPDPSRSDGCLTQINIEEFEAKFEGILCGKYQLAHWNRFSVKVDHMRLRYPVLCEAYFGEHQRENMSRHMLHWKRMSTRQRGSGLLVYTGAGSSGWAQSATGRNSFFRTEEYLRFALAEPYAGRISKLDRIAGEFKPGESFSVTSMNDSEGVVVLDALQSYPFPMGAVAKINTAPKLQVLIPL
jgi:hypothetical protein